MFIPIQGFLKVHNFYPHPWPHSQHASGVLRDPRIKEHPAEMLREGDLCEKGAKAVQDTASERYFLPSGANLSKITALPPGLRACKFSCRQGRPLGITERIKLKMTASNADSSTNRAYASPWIRVTVRAGSGSRERARASISRQRSTPTASTPSGSSGKSAPVPHPTRSARSPR